MYRPWGGGGGTGVGAVLTFQQSGDVVRRDLALGGVDAGAYHGPDHIVKEAVGAHPAGDHVALPGNVEVVDRADGGFGFSAHGAHTGEVVGAHKVGGGFLHHSFVQVLGVEPDAVDQKGVADAGVVDAVGVFLLDAAADGVEVLGHFRGLDYHDISRQTGVHRQGKPVAGDGGGGAEVGHIGLRVDAGVSAARAGALYRVADHHGQGPFQGLRYGDVPFLDLPAVVIGAVVHQGQSNVAHSPSFYSPKWRRTQTAATSTTVKSRKPQSRPFMTN